MRLYILRMLEAQGMDKARLGILGPRLLGAKKVRVEEVRVVEVLCRSWVSWKDLAFHGRILEAHF